MYGHRVPIRAALALLLCAAPAAYAAPKNAAASARQPAEAPVVRSARAIHDDAVALRTRIEGTHVDATDDIGLTPPRDITNKMIDAEMFFNLREFANCATLLAPALQEPGFAQHPAASRALYLVAESLYQENSLELARSHFQHIVDANDPVYGKDASKRLLQIALKKRDIAAVDRQYDELTRRYGALNDPGVNFVRARAQYYRRNFAAAAQLFASIPPSSKSYWKARYHQAIALSKEGQLEEAQRQLEAVERELDGHVTTTDDFDVLQLARLGQGILHYEHQRWNEAVAAYSRVERGSVAFEQALYQVSWTMIREERFADAITNLEVLALISSNTRFIAEAKLLASELRRRANDYDAALVGFEQVADDYGLIREQLSDIAAEPISTAKKYDAAETVLTGSVLANFHVDDWLQDDEIIRRALGIVREADAVGEWLVFNRDIASEIREALASGFAFDRTPELRDQRAALLEASVENARLRVELLERARASAGASEETAAARAQTIGAGQALFRAPATNRELQAAVVNERERLSDAILDVYRREQAVEAQIDNIQASDAMTRDRARLKLETAESASETRRGLRDERDVLIEQRDAIRAERQALQRQRVRYGIGEAQSATFERVDAYSAAADAELALLALTEEQREAWASIQDVDRAARAKREALQDAVAAAWATAYGRLGGEEGALTQLDSRYERKRSTELLDAEAAAMRGYNQIVASVDDVALRASLGEVDVAWWQKESVSRRIEALFRERERQIQRLDADFAEIRE